MTRWILSADLGQAHDPTALAVLEVSTRKDAVAAQFTDPPGDLAALVTNNWFRLNSDGGVMEPNAAVRVGVRHLERLPLRMSYPDQTAYIGSLLRRPPLASPRPTVVVDQTGVGRPVVEIMRRAGLRPLGVTITAGTGEHREYEGGYEQWKVAKLLLVSHMQAALHAGRLRIAKSLPDARALVEELADFRANINEAGSVSFGARSGAHDDLVLAVALGTWWAERQYAVASVHAVKL
jgi:hypothetical protein